MVLQVLYLFQKLILIMQSFTTNAENLCQLIAFLYLLIAIQFLCFEFQLIIIKLINFQNLKTTLTILFHYCYYYFLRLCLFLHLTIIFMLFLQILHVIIITIIIKDVAIILKFVILKKVIFIIMRIIVVAIIIEVSIIIFIVIMAMLIIK